MAEKTVNMTEGPILSTMTRFAFRFFWASLPENLQFRGRLYRRSLSGGQCPGGGEYRGYGYLYVVFRHYGADHGRQCGDFQILRSRGGGSGGENLFHLHLCGRRVRGSDYRGGDALYETPAPHPSDVGGTDWGRRRFTFLSCLPGRREPCCTTGSRPCCVRWEIRWLL